MEKISALIFTRNDVEKLFSLANNIYDLVDEIVVVDSSSRQKHQWLKEQIKKRKLSKIKANYAIALGYAEPLRSFGFSLCKNEWVLQLDVDEELSKAFKNDLHKIIEEKNFDVFMVKRYENAFSGKNSSYFTWQVRLFKKEMLEYFGLIHETPKILGKLGRLYDKKYYLLHKTVQTQEREREDYNEMDIFSPMPWYLLALRDIAIDFKVGNIHSFSDVKRNLLNISKKERRRTSQIKQIGKQIYKVGIIKYLGLDDKSTIDLLNKKYANKPQGIPLLIKLLKEKYEREQS